MTTLADNDLRLWADHAAQIGVHYITARARALAPWLTEDELDNLIERAGSGKNWTAPDLGNELNLTDAVRARLDNRTFAPVDKTKEQRLKRSKKNEAAAARTPHPLPRVQNKKTHAGQHRYAEITPALPAQWFYGCSALSSGYRAC